MAMTRDEFADKLKQQIDEWNAKIDRLEKRIREGRLDAEGAANTRMKELRERRDELKLKLKELQMASEDAWDDVKAGVDRAREELTEAFSKARSHYESEKPQ